VFRFFISLGYEHNFAFGNEELSKADGFSQVSEGKASQGFRPDEPISLPVRSCATRVIDFNTTRESN
jgi:hypothetical protein